MQPVVTVAEMRAIDDEARAAVSFDTLVARAGTALAHGALGLLGGGYGRRVVVLAGAGNNGADGAVAAGVLRHRGAAVAVVMLGDRPERIGDGADLVVDAAFGTGFHGTFDAPTVPDGVPVLACDIPSGIDGDSGEARGRPLRAELTVTFGAVKPGLLQGDGPDFAGRVVVADIGLDCSRAATGLVEDTDVDHWVPSRPRRTHKWQSAVAVVAGSPGMVGAAGMCARAAARAGAGMVRLGVPGAELRELPVAESVGQYLPATGWADEVLQMADRCAVVVVGPGLGRSDTTAAEVRRLVARCPVPVVVDADGLFALGRTDQAAAVVAERGERGQSVPDQVILTPHDGEYARLTGAAPGADRVAAARSLAAATGAVALVKGSTTAIAGSQGPALLCTAGSSRLATAGTGDVLSGMIAAFVARGADPIRATAAAAHVHGRAADLGHGVGLVAGDLPELVARWLSSRSG